MNTTSGVNLTKLFMSKFTQSFCKLDHFTGRNFFYLTVHKRSNLHKRVSKFTHAFCKLECFTGRIFFLAVLKRSSLHKRVSKFIPKKFYEINP